MPLPTSRIVIVGGGVTGLSLAVRLSGAGLPVLVFDRGTPSDAQTPESDLGWLHSGGEFARDDLTLARQCYESLQATRQYCPESIESIHSGMAYVVSRENTPSRTWTNAWERAGILYAELPATDFREAIPEFDADRVQQAFLLPDCSIQNAVLRERLVDSARQFGTELISGESVSRLEFEGSSVRSVRLETGEFFDAGLVVLAGEGPAELLRGDVPSPISGRTSLLNRLRISTPVLSISPSLGHLPFCVLDEGCLSHVPHGDGAYLGIGRWSAEMDERPNHAGTAASAELRKRLQDLVPAFESKSRAVREWQRVSTQPLQDDANDRGRSQRPEIVSHEKEFPPLQNLVTIFPGSASPWTKVADAASHQVLSQLRMDATRAAPSPWARRRPD